MKLLSSLFVSALFAASTSVAFADTIHLASYGYNSTGTKVVGPSDASNTVTKYIGAQYGIFYFGAGSSKTYDLSVSAGSPWTVAQGDSHWVAQNPGDAPGGGHVEWDGAYYYSTTFTDLNPTHSSGSITVMADDTTGVYLNGHEITDPASPATAGVCDSGTPNCTIPMSYFLPSSDFVSGVNTLSFDVLQEHGSAEGLDFVGSVNVTPEPDSLLLLGTGLAMLAGLAYSRRVQA